MASATTEWTVRRILEWTTGYLQEHGGESPRLEAELLLAQACGWPRIQLYTRFDEVLGDDIRARMREFVKRRGNAEPVAYLIGHREFFSLKFEVGPGVFIPRPDTETLVVEALERLQARGDDDATQEKHVLDVCTGSGCVAIAIAANAPKARVVAIERSPEALEFARRNANRLNVADRVDVRPGDLYSAVRNDETFDVIVSNPPYVTTAELGQLPADIQKFEPRAALDGGADGLDVVRRIVADAAAFLRPRSHLMFELSPDQADAAMALLRDAGFQEVTAGKDLSGTVRIVRGRRPE